MSDGITEMMREEARKTQAPDSSLPSDIMNDDQEPSALAEKINRFGHLVTRLHINTKTLKGITDNLIEEPNKPLESHVDPEKIPFTSHLDNLELLLNHLEETLSDETATLEKLKTLVG